MSISEFSSKDLFDSREIDERIDELEGMALEYENGDLDPNLDEDEAEEYDALIAFRDDVGSSEWGYGITFISDDYFEEYAEDLAGDLGLVDRENSMSTYIDWAAWARDCQMDYSSVELDGITFYFRA